MKGKVITEYGSNCPIGRSWEVLIKGKGEGHIELFYEEDEVHRRHNRRAAVRSSGNTFLTLLLMD